MQAVGGFAALGGGAEAGAGEAAGGSGLQTCQGILYHQAFFCGQTEHFRCHGKYLGIGLGAGDVIAVGYGVEESGKADTLQNQRGILAGGADGELQAPCPQLVQGIAHLIGQVFWAHGLQRLAVQGVFPVGQRCFFRIAERRAVVALQDDFQTFHPGDAPQAVVFAFVKIDAQGIGQRLPGKVMVVIGETDHAVQVKNDPIVFFHSLSTTPFSWFAVIA